MFFCCFLIFEFNFWFVEKNKNLKVSNSKNVGHHGWPMTKNFKIALAETP